MSIPSLASIASTFVAVILSVWLFFSAGGTQNLAKELQGKSEELQTQQQAVQTQQQIAQLEQQDIQKVNAYQQMVPPVMADLRAVALKEKDGRIRNLLIKYNVNMDEKPADAKPAATPSAAPAQ
jgi:hypothetical protein